MERPAGAGGLKDGSDDGFKITRASLSLKLLVVIGIYVPKIVIAVYCWWAGCRWLLTTTSFSDVVTNTVALEFIFNLDELMYETFESKDMREWVERHEIMLPPTRHVVRKVSESERLWERIRHRSIKVYLVQLVLVLATTLGYFKLQRAIPTWKGDVDQHCNHAPLMEWAGA